MTRNSGGAVSWIVSILMLTFSGVVVAQRIIYEARPRNCERS